MGRMGHVSEKIIFNIVVLCRRMIGDVGSSKITERERRVNEGAMKEWELVGFQFLRL